MVPKRRGPDKTPGARQRMAREVRNQLNNSFLEDRRRCRTRGALPDNPNTTSYHHDPLPTTSLPSDETVIDSSYLLAIPPAVITDVDSLYDISQKSQPQPHHVSYGRSSHLSPMSVLNLFDFPKVSDLSML